MLTAFVISAYLAVLLLLSLYGAHRYWILYLYWKHYKRAPRLAVPPTPAPWPVVTVQLPLYNEYYVVDRLLDAIGRLDYPRDRLEIQVLDDSTDDTCDLACSLADRMRAAGFDIHYLPRSSRQGYKAGALAWGLSRARGEFLAIFDADFLPQADFLRQTVPYFADPRLGMVQTRWGHVNTGYSLLTRLQSLFLDGHFMLEHTARNRSGAFFNFNGTAGVWRRATVRDAGGWTDDTLTEDLDLSYRAQLRGWKFLFLPEVVCPGELPVDIGSFRSQQHRWTKGALQVAKKVLPAIWQSTLPLFVKLESTVHLTANLGYAMVFLLSLLVFPSLSARRFMPWPQVVNALELSAFLLTSLSVAAFYIVVQRETRSPGTRLNLKDLPALMAFGIGMCLNNSRAIWEALSGVTTEFRRTAKFDIRAAGDAWRNKRYRTGPDRTGLFEVGLGVYLALALYWGASTATWLSLPFIGLFLIGYIYVGWLTIAHTARKS